MLLVRKTSTPGNLAAPWVACPATTRASWLRRPRGRRRAGCPCRSSRRRSAGSAAARAGRPYRAASSAGSPSSSSGASSSSACDIRRGVGAQALDPAQPRVVTAPSSPGATWVGVGAVDDVPVGAASASTRAIASRQGRAVRQAAVGLDREADRRREPAVAGGADEADRLAGARQRQGRDQVGPGRGGTTRLRPRGSRRPRPGRRPRPRRSRRPAARCRPPTSTSVSPSSLRYARAGPASARRTPG